MKLAEIKDVRVGQVWEWENNLFLIANENPFKDGYTPNYWRNPKFHRGVLSRGNDYKLMGKIGITHHIENNRLVEIPREDFQVDDVVTLADDSKWVLLHKQKFRERCFDGICLEEVQCARIFIDKSTKVGTIGVDYEIVSDCEVSNHAR